MYLTRDWIWHMQLNLLWKEFFRFYFIQKVTFLGNVSLSVNIRSIYSSQFPHEERFNVTGQQSNLLHGFSDISTASNNARNLGSPFIFFSGTH